MIYKFNFFFWGLIVDRNVQKRSRRNAKGIQGRVFGLSEEEEQWILQRSF